MGIKEYTVINLRLALTKWQVINKEAFMKKAVVFGMMALLLASSLALFSCSSDSGGSNKFIGTWLSSEFSIPKSNTIVPATAKFTGSDWSLTTSGITVNGTYSFSPGMDYYVILYQNSSQFGHALISNGSMSFSLISASGPLEAAHGTFTKQQQ